MEKQLVAAGSHGLKSPSNPMALIAHGYGDDEGDSDNDDEDNPNASKDNSKKEECNVLDNTSTTTCNKSQDTCDNEIPQKHHSR